MPSRSSSVKKKTSKPKSQPPDSPASEPNGDIYRALAYDNGSVGYLVTAPNNLHRPVAFVDCRAGSSEEGFKVADRIASFVMDAPWRLANDKDCIVVIDLTPFGHPDSALPMPTFVYSLRCDLCDSSGKPINDSPHVEPRPWCKFLFAELEKRKPAAATPITRPAGPDDFEVSDLFDQLDEIAKKTKEYLGVSSPLTQEFMRATATDDNGRMAQPAFLELALNTFKELPSATREAIFHGWNVCTEPRPREQLEAEATEVWTPIARGLRLIRHVFHGIDAHFESRFYMGCTNIELFIKQGTELEEVLLTLHTFEATIREKWALLIVDPTGKGVQK